MESLPFKLVEGQSRFFCTIGEKEVEFEVARNGYGLSDAGVLRAVAEAFVGQMQGDEGADGADFGLLQAHQLRMTYLRSKREVTVDKALASVITAGTRQVYRPPERGKQIGDSIYGRGIERGKGYRNCYANSALTMLNDSGISERLGKLQASEVRSDLAKIYSDQAKGKAPVQRTDVMHMMGHLGPKLNRMGCDHGNWTDPKISRDMSEVCLALHQEMDLPTIPRMCDAFLMLDLRYLAEQNPKIDANQEHLGPIWENLKNIAGMQKTGLFVDDGTLAADYEAWKEALLTNAVVLRGELGTEDWTTKKGTAYEKAALTFVLDQLGLEKPAPVDLQGQLFGDRMQAVQVPKNGTTTAQQLLGATSLQRDLGQADEEPPGQMLVYLQRQGSAQRVEGLEQVAQFSWRGREFNYRFDKVAVLSGGHYYVMVRDSEGWLKVDDSSVVRMRELPSEAFTHSYMLRLKR